jgi:hypothetical protein
MHVECIAVGRGLGNAFGTATTERPRDQSGGPMGDAFELHGAGRSLFR